MDIKQAKSITSLVVELTQLTDHFERCEYFRDNYKHASLEIQTDSKRSGSLYLDVSDEVIMQLFDKKLNDIGRKVAEINERILQLKVNVPDDVKD